VLDGFAAPSGEGFIALLEAFRATGGTVPVEILERLLLGRGCEPNSLAGLVSSGRVFSFDWRATHWVPMFQFDEDNLSPKEGPQRVRAALPSGWSGWTLACWFALGHARLREHSPANMMDGDLPAVMQAAQRQLALPEATWSQDYARSKCALSPDAVSPVKPAAGRAVLARPAPVLVD
jgi:hypothetical protein